MEKRKRLDKQSKKSMSKRGGVRLNAGRPAGSTNKDLRPLRQMLEDLVSANFLQLAKDLKKLSSYGRVDTIIRLMEFCVPKLQRINSISEISTGPAPLVIQVDTPERARETAKLLTEVKEKMSEIDKEYASINDRADFSQRGTIEDS